MSIVRYLLLSSWIGVVSCLSVSPSSSSELSLQQARGRLHESLKSLSGKLTLSPEICLPEPKDSTAILLQSTVVTTLSGQIRTDAKANAAFLSGSREAVQTFCNEQEAARGNFPGPIPIVFCDNDNEEDWAELVQAGVCAVLLPCALDNLDAMKAKCDAACNLGLQPIPEVLLKEADADTWTEESYMEDVVSKLTESMGQEPASILLRIQTSQEMDAATEPMALPPVPKALAKKIPILGSIAVMPGGNRMGTETKRLKAAGYTGAVLRSECLPPSFTEELELVGAFWSSCIGDLKSTKSKNFEFRTRNYLDKSMPVEWAKYQKSVIESGALGSPEDSASINSAGGDYQGF